MRDSKSPRGSRDRQRVASGEGSEVSYFAGKHGITARARDLIKQVGSDRHKLTAAAEKLKG